VRRGLAGAALIAVLFLIWRAWDHQAIMVWLRNMGPLPFLGAMALLPAMGVPVTPFFILAGATFGIWMALVASLVALGLNLSLCYWIARSGMRPRLESFLRRSRYQLPDFEERNAGAVRFTLMIKMTPGLPAFAKNYILGVSGVPFLPYFGLSMLITGAYAASFVILGESMLEHRFDRSVVAIAVVVVLLLAVLWWRRKRNREAQQQGAAHQPGG
jgi:uncharacterized membrane protein YdjX (TVP38/TMEM64 family)